jgi:hypothetical protein
MVGASFTVAAVAQVLRSKKGITAVGNAQIDIAQSQFGGASALFDGTTDYLLVSPTTDFAFGTNAFTVELWFRRANTSGTCIIYDGRASGGFSDNTPVIYTDGSTVYYYQGANRASTSFAATTWYHAAITRSGDDHKFWLNGTQIGSTYTNSGSVTVASTLTIGADQASGGGALSMNGHIDEIRVSNTARYSAGFTPSTAPFVNDANTLLLIHADGTDAATFFEDDNGLTRTPINGWQPESGVVISSTQSKFGGTSLYTPGEVTLFHNQYSGAGNGNALINFGTGDFTLEFWIYPTSTATTSGVITKRNISNTANGTWGIRYNGSTRVITWENIFPSVTSTSTASSAYTASTWSHWAFVRSSGTLKIYVDGVEKASASNSLDFTFNSEPIRIGDWGAGSTNSHIGYLDELRMSNTARYTAAFTAPTEPFVNDANTLLLMHMDGTPSVAVFRDDNGARAPLGMQANGNAAISSTQSKFGVTSGLFDGTGDYVTVGQPEYLNFGTGNWTIEGWYRASSTSGDHYMINFKAPTSGISGLYDISGGFGHWGINIYQGNWRAGAFNNKLVGGVGSGVNAGIDTTTWHHFALVRDSSTTLKYYIDGTQAGSTVTLDAADNFNSTACYIGNYVYQSGGATGWNGYIDDLRISNTARYTANFTAPTAPFQNDTNTLLLLHADGTSGSTVFIDDNGIAPYTP